MDISVLYVTNRKGGIDILKNNLVKQTKKDFELIIVDEFYNERKDEIEQYFKDTGIQIKQLFPRQPGPKDVWNLNKALNDGFSKCSGELIVVLQDYIWIPHDSLERFWNAPRHLISGVGHKAKFPDRASNLEGNLTIFEEEFKSKPEGVAEIDERVEDSGLDEANFSYFEFNYCSFPRKVVEELKGMDEEADQYFSGDNTQFAYRATLKGYKTITDRDNECIGLYHQYWFPRPKGWEEKHFNKIGNALTKYATGSS